MDASAKARWVAALVLWFAVNLVDLPRPADQALDFCRWLLRTSAVLAAAVLAFACAAAAFLLAAAYALEEACYRLQLLAAVRAERAARESATRAVLEALRACSTLPQEMTQLVLGAALGLGPCRSLLQPSQAEEQEAGAAARARGRYEPLVETARARWWRLDDSGLAAGGGGSGSTGSMWCAVHAGANLPALAEGEEDDGGEGAAFDEMVAALVGTFVPPKVHQAISTS